MRKEENKERETERNTKRRREEEETRRWRGRTTHTSIGDKQNCANAITLKAIHFNPATIFVDAVRQAWWKFCALDADGGAMVAILMAVAVIAVAEAQKHFILITLCIRSRLQPALPLFAVYKNDHLLIALNCR